jgi:uroporphyrinogen decarboxylase
MNNRERVTNILERKPVDYIPTQIEFTDYTRKPAIAKALGLKDDTTLDDYLQNCLYLTFAEDEIPIFFRNFDDVMRDMEKKGFARVDFKNEIVYDRLGQGTMMHIDTYRGCYAPLEGNDELDKLAAPFLPESFTRLFGLPLEKKIHLLQMPDGGAEGSLDLMLKDFAEHNDDDQFLFPTGYFGIYERSYSMIGWEQFMMEIANRPNIIHELLEKVTEYKVQLAKMKVEKTPAIIHHIGDDLGGQISGLFSVKMFREMLKPYFKRVFDVYTGAGCHVCLHSCGLIIDYLPDLIEIGVDMIEPVQTVNDMKVLKEKFGKDIIFWGGIETQKLPFADAAGVRKLVEDAMWNLAKGGGAIIGPSQQVQKDTPIENIKVMVETIMELREKVL